MAFTDTTTDEPTPFETGILSAQIMQSNGVTFTDPTAVADYATSQAARLGYPQAYADGFVNAWHGWAA